MKQPFIPFELPITNLNLEKLIFLVGEASKQLSLYNGILQVIINPNILLAPITTQEAILSSKIEGTQVSFTEFLNYEAGEKYNEYKTNDINEVSNYKNAMLEAENMLENRPFIHLNMIKDLHNILLSGVRGNNKSRGEFRKIQVYIGSTGCTIDKATFIPPEAQNILPALDKWEKYINNNEQETLIQCAIMHAQFEMIHPFLDGNGRMGRMLIPIFLYQKQYIEKPVFYLSEFFETNKQEYYKLLNDISENNNWQSWIEFFLKAIIEQSNKNIIKSKEIINLYNNMKQEILLLTHSEYAINILDNLFKKPIITSRELWQLSNISSSRVGNILFNKLINNNIIEIVKEGKGSRPSVFSFAKLINIVDNS